MATNPDDQPIEPIARALTIREAELATGINGRSIRRRLAAGTFPGAFKDADVDRPNARVWRIPVEDLEAAGLGPVDLESPSAAEPGLSVVTSSPAPTVVTTDRFGRLRTELAEAVAAAEVALLRAEAEKWRAVAEERARALERADVALHTLATTVANQPSPGPAAPPPPAPSAEERRPASSAVPQHVRNEAVLYAEIMKSRRNARNPCWRRRR